MAEQYITIVIPPTPSAPPSPPVHPVLIAFIGAGAIVLGAVVAGAFALAAALAPIVAHGLGR